MELGPAFDDKIDGVFGQELRIVVDEYIHVGDLDFLVHMRIRRLGGMHRWKLDVGVRLVFSASDGERGIEGI